MIYRSFTFAATLFATLGLFSQAQDDQRASLSEPASVLTVEAPGDSEANVGDLIRLPVTYPIVPGSMLSNLKAQVHGEAVKFVTVANSPTLVNGHPVMGAGNISVFVVANHPGESIVKVMPVKTDGRQGDPRIYRIKVSQLTPSK